MVKNRCFIKVPIIFSDYDPGQRMLSPNEAMTSPDQLLGFTPVRTCLGSAVLRIFSCGVTFIVPLSLGV